MFPRRLNSSPDIALRHSYTSAEDGFIAINNLMANIQNTMDILEADSRRPISAKKKAEYLAIHRKFAAIMTKLDDAGGKLETLQYDVLSPYAR
jgi:type IV pilus biogenesis protein CpaD/CtpE